MDTFESISEPRESRLGNQSGYNAGQQAAEQVQQSRCSSRAVRAASGAGEKKQMQRKAARLDKPNGTRYTAKH